MKGSVIIQLKKIPLTNFQSILLTPPPIPHPKTLPTWQCVVEKQLGKKTKKKLLPLQTGDVVKTIANVKKEQSKMGFKFKIDIQEGIRRFAIWFKNEK